MATYAEMLEWKFPGKEGVETKNGVVTKFGEDPLPSQNDLDTWLAEYEASTFLKEKLLENDIELQGKVVKVLIALLDHHAGDSTKLNNLLAKWPNLKAKYGL